jgi:VanZ family protein
MITFILAIEIFLFSTIKTTGGSGSGLNLASVYHFGIFFMFSFFLFLLIKGKEKPKIKYILIALFISVVYAVSDEIHQLFVPGRVFSIKDIIIDSLGSLSSILICSKISKK